MNKAYLTILILTLCIQVFGTDSALKDFDLKSLENCNDKLAIRITERNLIIDINTNESINAELILSIQNQHQRNILSPQKSKILLDSLLSKGILELPDDNFRGIDGTTSYIETVIEGNYKKVSYWSARSGAQGVSNAKNRETVKDIILFIQDFLNFKGHWNSFYETLDPGIYHGLNIDRFAPPKHYKSDIYVCVEKFLRTDFGLDENSSSQDFPLIKMGQQYYSIEDLNSFSMSNVDSIRVIKPDELECVRYGALGQKNGLVLIELKEK